MYRNLSSLKKKISMPQKTLKEVKSQKGLKIFVDHREKGSGILKQLVNMDIDLDLQSLDMADYILSSRCGVEYKTIDDFAQSVIDGRLLDQIKNLKHNFDKPLLIVEGTADLFSARNIHPNATRGMLATVAVSFGVPILFTRDNQDTAELLVAIAKREQDESGSSFSLHSKKPLSFNQQQEYVVSSIPNVGPALAKDLLKHFKTIKQIVNSEESDLQKVPKLGPKKAKDIRKVFDEEYKF